MAEVYFYALGALASLFAVGVILAKSPMLRADPIRKYLKARGCPDFVFKGGVEGLLRGWEDVVQGVARGGRWEQEEYVNEMDGRQILADLLARFEVADRAQVDERLARADALLRSHVVPTKGCLWGEENEVERGYAREQHWWYYHRPRIVDETWWCL